MGSARLAGRFVELLDADTIASLADAWQHGWCTTASTTSTARCREPSRRALTQGIGRLLYGEEVDGAPVAGVCDESRHGAGLRLWAVFERASGDVEPIKVEPVDIDDDEALQEALHIHGLSVA